MSEPLTIEEYIGTFDLEVQKDLRQALTQQMNLINSWAPERRGEKTFLAFLFLQRGVTAALDQPFEPDTAKS